MDLQVTKMDRSIFGVNLLPEQIQTMNPFFLLVFIPIFNYGIYPILDKKGLKTTPLRRIGAGLILLAISFVVIALIQTRIDAGGMPTIRWQVFAYALLAASEVLVSITGLEYAYTQASKSMKSTMIAIWLLTKALGNLFTALVNRSMSNGGFFAQYKGADYYWFFIGLITVFIIIYLFVSPRIKQREIEF